MSTDLFTPRSSSMATRDFGSTFSCSSSEASSRLAARLERSEYKRTRAKQRLNSSSRNHCRRRDSKGSKKNNSAPSTRETRTKSEEDGVTSVWEVYRQNPYYYSDRTADDNKQDKKEQRYTWYGMPSTSQPSQRRPQSIHIGSMDHSNLEHQSWSPAKQRQINSFNDNVDQDNFEQRNKTHNSQYGNNHSPTYNDAQHPIAKEIQGDYSLGKKGMYLSRSLSSSFSSYVGSSDEKEDSQGIYSAYDVASRSPYEPMLSRRYSQSSLSSSSASWHQHQSPSLNYNMRDIPSLLDPPASKSHQRSNSKSPKSNNHYSDFREEFQVIREVSPPAVPPKPKKYSSSYTIQLHSSAKDDLIQGLDHNDGKGPSVREMAKKFTPTSVRHISSVYNNLEDDMIRAKTENWVKAVSVSQQESPPPFEKNYVNVESSPPRSLHNEDKNWGVVMRQKEKSNKTPEELASHRLSLQELIQLHEEQIAIQAKSAKAIPVHAYTKLRSPTSVATTSQNRSDFDCKGTKTTVQHESPKGQVGKPELKSEKLPENYKTANSSVQKEHSDYEVREVLVSQTSPFKVIELTDKAVDTPKGRISRLKRHRTIGIVGYRHQIDRTSGEKVQTKQKRHTTVGIVSDFTDSSTEVLSKSQELPTKRDHSLYPLRNTEYVKHDDVTPSNSSRLDDNTKPFPVKIFDIESNSEQSESQTLEAQEAHQNEQFTTEVAEQVVCVSAECWYSGVSEDKDFLEFQKVDKYSPAVPDSTNKEDVLLSSSTMEPQQDVGLSVSSTTEKYSSTFQDTLSRNYELLSSSAIEPQQDVGLSVSSTTEKYSSTFQDTPSRNYELLSSSTMEPPQDLGLSVSSTTEKYSITFQDTPSRNSHSPVVELLPGRKGNATAFYKSAVTSHSHLKKPLLDTPKELPPSNLHNFGMTKSHSIPVAQVSPVNQSLGSQEILQAKAVQVASPPPLPPSAHEMYETRLAMWDLLPHQRRSLGNLSEPLSNEGHLSFGDNSKDNSYPSKDLSPSKFVPPTFENKRDPSKDLSPSKFVPPTFENNRDIKGSSFSLNFQRLNKTEDYYLGVIETLNADNQRLKEKNEAEKRDFRRMYEDQKKVANAYQKLEDRYRRRVHELQDALASCTCQGSLMVKESNLKSSHLNHRNGKESHTSKLQSSKSGLRMFEELEEWLSEQSKNSKAPKANATSRDSLISSSSDLTGTGWDEHCDMYGGDIDEVNGTHV